MTICRHIRRPTALPRDGEWWIVRCDCGWEGRTAQFGGPRARTAADVGKALEGLFLGHLGANERRTYLLLDTRQPVDFRSLEQIMSGPGPRITLEEARLIYEAQCPIVGNFVMPEGLPVLLLAAWQDDGVHWGRYRIGDGPELDLPIGEVRTPEGKVYRLNE